MRREIVLGTETDSTDAKVDRFIEVGCVELVDHTQTLRVVVALGTLESSQTQIEVDHVYLISTSCA